MITRRRLRRRKTCSKCSAQNLCYDIHLRKLFKAQHDTINSLTFAAVIVQLHFYFIGWYYFWQRQIRFTYHMTRVPTPLPCRQYAPHDKNSDSSPCCWYAPHDKSSDSSPCRQYPIWSNPIRSDSIWDTTVSHLIYHKPSHLWRSHHAIACYFIG